MEKELQIFIDFVEGRLSDIELDNLLRNNDELRVVLQDNSMSWSGTYIKTDPFDYLMSINIKSISGRLEAQGVLELFLGKKGIKTKEYKKYSKDYGIILDVQPDYIDPDSEFVEKFILPPSYQTLSLKEIKQIAKENIKSLFQYNCRPPKWIQSASAWPIENNKPLYFIGQVNIKGGEVFHDDGAAYLFMDKETGKIETIIQLY